MIDRLKAVDRALLELITGILVFGVLAWLIGIFLPLNRILYTTGLWCGVVVALFSAVHMWRCLQKAFMCDEKGAVTVMTTGYIVRYLVVCALLVMLFVTGIGYPLAGFVGVMSLKVGAYLQPVLHKFYNYIFHETDPIAQPIVESEEEKSEE